MLENPRFLNSHERVGSRLSSHDGSRGASVNQPDVTSKDRFLSSRQRYQEIVNKASCLSWVSNTILYWNTIKIAELLPKPQHPVQMPPLVLLPGFLVF